VVAKQVLYINSQPYTPLIEYVNEYEYDKPPPGATKER